MLYIYKITYINKGFLAQQFRGETVLILFSVTCEKFIKVEFLLYMRFCMVFVWYSVSRFTLIFSHRRRYQLRYCGREIVNDHDILYVVPQQRCKT